MKNYFLTFALLLSLIVNSKVTQAQRIIKIGFTGGAARFYPEAQHLGANLNNSMGNGLGWSAGVFIQENWKPKIKQIVELNYYALSSDVFLQKNPQGPWSPNDGTGRQPIYGNFQNTPFNLLAISGGIKYLLTDKLFVYPGFEIARSLSKKIEINKTTYHVKFGAGVTLKHVDFMLEYAYGLKYQQTVYDCTVPFASTHRNKYLQLKVHIPLYRVR